MISLILVINQSSAHLTTWYLFGRQRSAFVNIYLPLKHETDTDEMVEEGGRENGK